MFTKDKSPKLNSNYLTPFAPTTHKKIDHIPTMSQQDLNQPLQDLNQQMPIPAYPPQQPPPCLLHVMATLDHQSVALLNETIARLHQMQRSLTDAQDQFCNMVQQTANKWPSNATTSMVSFMRQENEQMKAECAAAKRDRDMVSERHQR